MLDPREQQKGGFGAFAARERERRAVKDLGTAPDATGTSDPTPAAPAPAESTEPPRRRFFRSML